MFESPPRPNSASKLQTQDGYDDENPSLNQKGEFVAIGSTSYVERLPNGTIIKTAWPGGDRARQRRHEIATEAKIYDRLGEHRCLVKKKTWNPEEFTLTLEDMPNGTLKDYLESHANVPMEQRKKWATEAIECIQFLHSSAIIHCDIGPHNFLLDDRLRLKIIDFSGSSIDGSDTEISPGTRYAAPTLDRSLQRTPTVRTDLFSLGSTIYYIMMGQAPFEEFQSEDVHKMYRNQEFPDLTGIPHADIIRSCWAQEFESVDGLVPFMDV
ncbi:Receptor-interacting serine/threonine-protein kinase 1 [Colletotrichum spinosum]|uniref:Receptor-interacting serine/threonine-protein kinase 1 n=2 Tax=Colletotrichum orbiculare species complex TaxID=2707354 RepID=A0A4V3HTR5_COLTR|nr:Receptor-interacting serine/threonine-protein kinase 1 [Colletotrichum spinosum]TDZ39549.1 Receptor-interacting serine/threonine-protein kinase 1 [Colletotrichum trifolii]